MSRFVFTFAFMSEVLQTPVPPLTAKDFATDQEVRWCPGCGDYSILAQVQKVMPGLGIPRENIVIISGIGLQQQVPLLYEYLWNAFYSWKSYSYCFRPEGFAARTKRLGSNGRWGRIKHRWQSYYSFIKKEFRY